jgi:hypothetical protein
MLQGKIWFNTKEYCGCFFQEEAEAKSVPSLCPTTDLKEIEGVDLSQKRSLIFYMILSILGVILLFIGSLYSSPNKGSITTFDKTMVGGAFITSCVIGLSLALKPNWMKGIIKGKQDKEFQNSDYSGLQKSRYGHHPDCKGFNLHVIKTDKQTYCAGCLGLGLGSVLGIILVGLYIFFPLIFESMSPISIIMVGFIFIIFNFLVGVIRNRNKYLHMGSNVVLVMGFFFVVFGVHEQSANILLGILAVILSFLWLDTRIQLSHWHHKNICGNCANSCKAYGA